MSAPEANERSPAPRTTRTLTLESEESSASKPGSSRYIPRAMALWLSGRFNVRVATDWSRVTVRWSDTSAPAHLGVGVVNRSVGEQLVEFGVGDAGLGEQLAGVLPEPRRRAAYGGLEVGGRGRRAARAHRAAAERSDTAA